MGARSYRARVIGLLSVTRRDRSIPVAVGRIALPA
jgi:hypothetical protein